MGEMIEVVTPSQGQRTVPIREDCWSEEATGTLVEAWGSRYLELNRGNLRQKDWQEVADAVNALHGLSKKTYRTDVQCKNRIDTIKKKYKVEKARHVASGGTLASSWPFFERMDLLIGSTFPASKKGGNTSPVSPPLPMALPLKRILGSGGSLPRKRVSSVGGDGEYFRRNYSAMAAAAAADTDSEEDLEEEVEEEMEEEQEEEDPPAVEKSVGGSDGIKRLVQAIERFGEVYEKVEREKLRQMVDLEKQRMKFAKDLEMERMRIFTETQIQLERIKKGVESVGGGGKIHHQFHRSTLGSNDEKDF